LSALFSVLFNVSTDIFGYEDFIYNHLSTCLTSAKLNASKEIALIAVPSDFDASQLKGQIFIPNAASSLDQEEESSILRWEIQSKTIQPEFSILLPSNDDKNNLTLPSLSIDHSLTVKRMVHVPPLKYPKKSKKVKKLPVPENLCTRWKPFGDGEPCKSNKTISVDTLNNTENNADKKKKVKVSQPMQAEEELRTKKKKKHNKKKKNNANNNKVKEEETEYIQKVKVTKENKAKCKQTETEESDLDSDEEEKLLGIKKKKKKKREHSETENEIINELKTDPSPVKKKKKKKKND